MTDLNVDPTTAIYFKDMLKTIISDAKEDEKAFEQPIKETEGMIETLDEKTSMVPIMGFPTYTFIDQLFSVNGQGIPENSNTILTGLPSSGKSLLCMEIALQVANSGRNVCYVTSEEIFKSIAGRYSLEVRMFNKALTLKLDVKEIKKHLFVIDTVKYAELREWVNFVGEYRRLVDKEKIEMLIVDSVTMLEDSRTQMKNRLLDLSRFNQTHGVTSIMINQRAVEESDNMAMAGGIALSHIVDTVMVMDYKKVSSWDAQLKQDIPTAKQGQQVNFFRILKCRLCRFKAQYKAYEITDVGLIREIKNAEM